VLRTAIESGEHVCLPDGARGPRAALKYADADCTEAALVGALPESGYFAPFGTTLLAKLSNSLGLGEIYTVGDAGTGDVYELTAAQDCQLFASEQSFTVLSQNDPFPILETEVE
jgi:hypothetical protein